MSGLRVCALIPTYDNPRTIAHVVARVRQHLPDVIVIDDGSAAPAQHVLAEIAARGEAQVVWREHNGGKGAAVKQGFALAISQGYTHALQIDADDQHCSADIPRFLEAARRQPDALILGSPQFSSDAPKSRLWGRLISVFFVHLETGGRVINDPLCGYRLYPLAAALACAPRSNHMEFDPEIAVRMAWRGVPVQNLTTAVRYVSRAEGGVSHFKLVRDNVRISLMHSRLMTRMIMGRLFGWLVPALAAHNSTLTSPADQGDRAQRRAT